MDLGALLRERCIAIGLEPTEKSELLTRMVDLATTVHNVGRREAVVEALAAREAVGSTGIGNGVALPHARCASVSELILAAATIPDGMDFQSLDGEPARLVFLILSPKNAPGEHLKLMAKLTRLLSEESVRNTLIEAPSAGAFWSAIYEAAQNLAEAR